MLAPSLPYLRYLQNESRQHQAKFAIFSHHMKPFYQSIPSQFYYLLAIYLSNLLVPFGFMDDMAVVRAAQKNNFETLMPDFDVENYRIPGDEHLSPEGNQKLAVLMGSLLSERRALLSPKN